MDWKRGKKLGGREAGGERDAKIRTCKGTREEGEDRGEDTHVALPGDDSLVLVILHTGVFRDFAL